MDTGLRLKYHRLKKKISLEEVASGILSPRELKKIESGLKEPSLADLEALCKKLEIPLAPKDNPVGKVLVKNFKSSLVHPQNKGKIMEQYSDIKDHPLLHVNEDIELEYSIQQIRYFIVIGDLDTAELKLKEMERFKEFMNQEQFYLFHKYNGNYHYILNDHETALKTYLMAEKIAPSTTSPSELGDLYYSIGISSSQCWETELAFKYTDLALKIYQQEFVPKRIVECHLNIAMTQQRIGNFKIATEHFKNALTIGRKLEIDILRFTTEFNVGYSNFLFQNFEASIHHVTAALEFVPAEYTADILLSYCLIIKCNIELENIEEALKWQMKGEEIVVEKHLNLNLPTNHAFKEAIMEFFCLSHYLNGEYDQFESLVVNTFLPSLSVNDNFYEIGYYYGLLGNLYYNQERYKDSSFAFNNSRLAYKNLITIK
ncbi:Transcriptional activator NprA [Planococcus massiliensis]|uniref:Transcriptional activator NprA n=1 Tax=Planococcus massiliensis TaxID=1499687 RepID=A0A098ELP9_9BACL|nr:MULTISPECIES: helix-turn-helix transcriptional regulator [Planococcus]MCJ1906967.1 helix-turn-helix transcriptional regulator [Planococcus ruber]CEG22201.1 Transcriptional activator NprA [Planococcus massiliensis]